MRANLDQQAIRERWSEYWSALPKDGRARKAVADAIGISESLCRRFLNEDIADVTARRIALYLEHPTVTVAGMPQLVSESVVDYHNSVISINLSMLPRAEDLVTQMAIAHERDDRDREEQSRQLIFRTQAVKRRARDLQAEINGIVGEFDQMKEQLNE